MFDWSKKMWQACRVFHFCHNIIMLKSDLVTTHSYLWAWLLKKSQFKSQQKFMAWAENPPQKCWQCNVANDIDISLTLKLILNILSVTMIVWLGWEDVYMYTARSCRCQHHNKIQLSGIKTTRDGCSKINNREIFHTSNTFLGNTFI